ncbi:ATP-grasp domain-containing protein [Anaerocolumna chitinilytica]|uniref:ATP-grasp domain-containing protein n=1 Tax=Anaerocolumna chitinilytica TaxID=1727145 RepID=A0A7I8DRW7_9FIRM|nr:RimK family alpha-L-glutamate ligase [Anaerocolumna chitinilytica]BCJ99865.1 hypothetical protein bsdcttw_29060 [Anaerocolumna chitinilytica]
MNYKKGLILVNAFSKLKSAMHQPVRLKDELKVLGIECDIKPCSIETAMIISGSSTSFLKDYDFIIYLDKDKYTSALLEKTGKRLFNSHEAILTCDDKMMTHIALSDKGIKMPDTIPGLLCYNKDASLQEVMKRIEMIEQRLGYPCIIKECYGSLGSGVFRAENRDELLLNMEKVKCKEHLFQKMINSSEGKDARVIVIGGKVACSMKRISDTDFRSNIELGGRAEVFDLPPSFKEISEKVADILKLDYCGIDLLFGESGEPVVCEVNSNAFFGGMESVTGFNVAGAYARHIKEIIYETKVC